MSYRFVTLDPRPGADNEAVFSGGPVFGIEVTVPALAAKCAVNIDPQHSGGNPELAAIEVAMHCALPPDGAVLVTVRADLDSVGTMAVLALRLGGYSGNPEAQQRLEMVATADKFANGPWPGPRPLPSMDNPWPKGGSAGDRRELAAMAAAVADHKVPLDRRVEWVQAWLVTGQEPRRARIDSGEFPGEIEYRDRVEAERAEMIRALEAGEIRYYLADEGQPQVVVVLSTYRSTTIVGYALAPVIVALNPEFRVGGGQPHAKFTVCQHEAGYVDLSAARAELNNLETIAQAVAELDGDFAVAQYDREQDVIKVLHCRDRRCGIDVGDYEEVVPLLRDEGPAGRCPEGYRLKGGWGGSPTIIGSPQGVASLLTTDQVVEVVCRHLIK